MERHLPRDGMMRAAPLLISALSLSLSSTINLPALFTEGSGVLQGALRHAHVHRKCHIDISAYTHTLTTVCMLQPLSSQAPGVSLSSCGTGAQYQRGLVMGEWVHRRRRFCILTAISDAETKSVIRVGNNHLGCVQETDIMRED